MEQYIKIYYTSPWKLRLAGIMLILMGLNQVWIGLAVGDSPEEALASFFRGFRGLPGLWLGLFCLLLLILGIFFIRKSSKFVRCRLSETAFYHLKFDQPKNWSGWSLFSVATQYLRDAFFSPEYIAIPYSDIAKISLEGSRWTGIRLYITRKSTGEKELMRAMPESPKELEELVKIVQSHLEREE